jgi:hypothetical protein
MSEISDLDEVDSANTIVSGFSTNGATANMSTMDDVLQAVLGMLKRWFKTSLFRLRDSTDQTKLLAFDLSGITAATTRTLVVPNKSGTIALNVTDWVKYTPTYSGFGTPPVSRIWSRRVGDSLEIRGNFALGTPTAVEARMSLGFGGVDGGITADATKVEQLQAAGHVITSTPSTTGAFAALIGSGLGYINFGYSEGGSGGLLAVNGTSMGTNSEQVSLNAIIPITGW